MHLCIYALWVPSFCVLCATSVYEPFILLKNVCISHNCLQIICSIKVLLFYMHVVSYWQLNKHYWFTILCFKFILYQGLLPYKYIKLFPIIGLSHLFVINICIEDVYHMLLLGTQLRPWDFCLDFRIIFDTLEIFKIIMITIEIR